MIFGSTSVLWHGPGLRQFLHLLLHLLLHLARRLRCSARLRRHRLGRWRWPPQRGKLLARQQGHQSKRDEQGK